MNIEFYTSDDVAAKHFPPLPASQMLPDWYKDMPRYSKNREDITAQIIAEQRGMIPQTIKGCLPFMDYLTSGYVIRASADVVITPITDGNYKQWAGFSYKTNPTAHPHGQCPIQLNNVKNDYVKIMNPWKLKTPLGYSTLFYQPEFLIDGGVRLFPAVVDTDVYNYEVHFPGIVVADSTVVIKAGAPLIVAFPFIRQEWTHSIIQAPEKDNPIMRFFERGYQELFHQPKKYK